ncbi:O-antigen polymerase [Lederbergia lenta]|uniref:Oligosaccharide repeat unit polymerase n=1 Tax=Lederbergia lenta TaxID=1467 RepID=A0A2X4WI62_LEDLE|nr:O-antigen polymerase [Lederbergia lenta]MEC2323151.1 O-antigen ligase [Lederbergia lenta]SQI62821.1 Uncharacterised protein [Lederbergia lenta]
MYLILFLYIIIGCIVIRYLYKKNKRLGFVGGYAGFTFSMLVYYVFIPIIIILCEDAYKTNTGYGFDKLIQFIFTKGSESFLFLILIVVIGFISFNFGYSIVFLKKYKTIVKDRVSRGKINNNRNFNNTLLKIINFGAHSTLIIGGSALILFFIFVGGIGNALKLAETTRGFEVSVAEFNYLAGISKIIARIVTIAPIMYFYLILNRKKFSDKFLFSISFILSVLLYLSFAGRTPLMTFLIIFLYFIAKKFFNRVWLKIIFVGIACFPLLDIFNYIFIFFQTQVWVTTEINYLQYLRQFSFPMSLGLNIRELVSFYDFRYYKDVFNDIVGLLPGIGFEVSYENTSEFFNGSNWRLMGGVPNDVISYGYIQLGMLGVFITLSTWGFLMGCLDKIIKTLPRNSGRDLISVTLATQVYQIVFSADLAPILQSHLIFLLLVIILVIYKRYIRNNKTDFNLVDVVDYK